MNVLVFRFMSWLKETGASREAGGKKREKECEKKSGKGRRGELQKGREWRGAREV